MSSKPIRYGIVGLGRAGWDIHVAALRGRDKAQIVAVADPVEERRNEAKAEFGCETYDNINKLLKDKNVEVVVIATPSALHGPDTKKAFKAGKHVVVEKPMAMSTSEADSMIKASKEAKKKLFVHQNYRFNKAFTFLEDIVSSGIIGKLFYIKNYGARFARRNDWQTLSKNGGGILNNTCPHNVDQIMQLIGAPAKKVLGDLQQIASAGDVEDHVKALIKGKNGVTCDMEITSAVYPAVTMPNWILAGTCGTCTVVGQQATIHYFDPKKAPPLKAEDGYVKTRAYGNDDKLPWETKEVPAQGRDVGDFYDNVWSVLREKGKMRVTPESVREVIRVLDMIRKDTKFPGKPKKK